MKGKLRIAYNLGDGVGPEMMRATLRVLNALNLNVEWIKVDVGAGVTKGFSQNLTFQSIEEVKRSDAFLKAPIESPRTSFAVSAEAILHQELGIYASLCPIRSYAPVIPSDISKMDLLMVCESEDTMRSNFAYRQSASVAETVHLMSTESVDRVIDLALCFSERMRRKNVALVTMTEDALSDQLLKERFHCAQEAHKTLSYEHLMISEAARILATHPEKFDVLIVPGNYAGILTDIALDISRSHALCGFAHFGVHGSIFESPLQAKQKVKPHDVNPSSLFVAAALMLLHLNKPAEAQAIINGLLTTLEHGLHTQDIYRSGVSASLCTTQEFTSHVIDNLSIQPHWFDPAVFTTARRRKSQAVRSAVTKELVGFDVCVDARESIKHLKEKLKGLPLRKMRLEGIHPYACSLNQQRKSAQMTLRFLAQEGQDFSGRDLIPLLDALSSAEIECFKTESLYNYNGLPGFGPF